MWKQIIASLQNVADKHEVETEFLALESASAIIIEQKEAYSKVSETPLDVAHIESCVVLNKPFQFTYPAFNTTLSIEDIVSGYEDAVVPEYQKFWNE